MKTSSASAKQTPPVRSAILKSESVSNSTSSKAERQTSKVRNFGWLVMGMVEDCY